MGAQSIPTHITKPVIIKKLVCKRNNKLLKSYGIVKGDVVDLENEDLLLVKYYDETAKINRYVKLSRKLMKLFKEE